MGISIARTVTAAAAATAAPIPAYKQQVRGAASAVTTVMVSSADLERLWLSTKVVKAPGMNLLDSLQAREQVLERF